MIGKIKPSILELDQYWKYQDKVYCFRSACEDCRWQHSCEYEEVEVKVGPGVNIRRSIVAPPGYKLVSIDYKGIELRIAAQLSGEPFWVEAFKNNRDLHTEFAKIAFKTDSPTKDQRDQAKAANFGNLYLGTPHTLSRQSNLTLPEAVFIHREWWKALPVYKRWTDNQLEIAKREKKVKTFFGRERHLARLINEAEEAELTGKKKGAGKAGWPFIHRTAFNSPVQGCLRPTVKVLTSEGYISIGELWSRQKQNIPLPKVWTGNVFANFKVVNRGEAQYVNLHIKRRGVLECDDRHELKVPGETGWKWKSIRDFRIGEVVAISRPKLVENYTIPRTRVYKGVSHNSKSLVIDFNSEEWYYFVGFLLGDGCFGVKNSGYWFELITSEDEAGELIRKKVEGVLKHFGYNSTPNWKKKDPNKKRLSWSIDCKALGLACIDFGLVPNCGASNKEIPDLAFQGSLKCRKSLIEGLFDTDGTKDFDGWGWHNSSQKLIKGLYLCLRSLGVDSRYSETGAGTWKLDISSKRSFSELLGKEIDRSRVIDGGPSLLPFQTKQVIECLEDKMLDSSGRTIRSRLRGGGTTLNSTAERLTGTFLDELHYYDEVEAIEYLKEWGETYTLSVEDSYHQFDSEGVISKNTGADLMKMAMVRVTEWIVRENLFSRVKIILTVHDEIVFLIQDGPDFFTLIETISSKMVPDLSSCGWEVPLGVDVEVGDNWADLYDLKDLKKERGFVETKNSTLDPTLETRTEEDRCILVLDKELTREQFLKLQTYILKASDVKNVVKSPLRIKVKGNLYKMSSPWKVHEPTLKMLTQDIEGLKFED